MVLVVQSSIFFGGSSISGLQDPNLNRWAIRGDNPGSQRSQGGSATAHGGSGDAAVWLVMIGWLVGRKITGGGHGRWMFFSNCGVSNQ